MGSDLPPSLTVIFDGRCGMCTRAIAWIKRHDAGGRIVAHPCQSSRTFERFGVTPNDCEKSVWAVTPDGVRVSAGQATILVLAVLMQQRWVLTLGRAPGVRQLLEIGYRFVARNRRRIPGMTPRCESHPDECASLEKADPSDE